MSVKIAGTCVQYSNLELWLKQGKVKPRPDFKYFINITLWRLGTNSSTNQSLLFRIPMFKSSESFLRYTVNRYSRNDAVFWHAKVTENFCTFYLEQRHVLKQIYSCLNIYHMQLVSFCRQQVVDCSIFPFIWDPFFILLEIGCLLHTGATGMYCILVTFSQNLPKIVGVSYTQGSPIHGKILIHKGLLYVRKYGNTWYRGNITGRWRHLPECKVTNAVTVVD